MFEPKQIAIVGATASGKSGVAIKVAKRYNGVILSIDSLSIYKEIDIASAKPTPEERGDIIHFGIDLLYPDEYFNAQMFSNEYKKALQFCKESGKSLILVGGSSFYLKALIDGLSQIPEFGREVKERVDSIISKGTDYAYDYLSHLDLEYAKSIEKGDRYRVEKALLINIGSGMGVREYFKSNPPTPKAEGKIPIIEIETDRDTLRERITIRTINMIESGLIDEVAYLEKRYSRDLTSMKAIGVREVLDYFDGRYNFNQMREKIITNTARLAKRQNTFNRSQFRDIDRYPLDRVVEAINRYFCYNNS